MASGLKNWLKSGKTLTNAEAQEYQEPLTAAILDYGMYADQYLALHTQQPEMVPVWGDLTELEASTLARIMIRRGQKNAAAAAVVRNMVNGTDYISAAVIVVPRVIRTVEEMQKAPRKGRKRSAA